MDSADAIVIRSAEPADAAAISALLGTPGTMEGTLQLPDLPVASRLEMLERVDPQSCRLVAIAGKQVVGWAALHAVQAGLRRGHVRQLAIALSPTGRGAAWAASSWPACWTGPTTGPACCASS